MKVDPSNLEDHLGFWLRKLSNLVSDSFAARLERHDISVPQWVVLRVLFDHDALALKDIVDRVGVDQGALSRMVERLLGRGLVTRQDNPSNRREVAISLTKEGRRLVPKLAQEADENDRVFFVSLPVSKRKDLLKTVQSLLAANSDEVGGIPLQ